jgi:hypothetical protein
MAHGIGLVFPEKRKADVYRKIAAWHDHSFTTFHYCLSRLNALFHYQSLAMEIPYFSHLFVSKISVSMGFYAQGDYRCPLRETLQALIKQLFLEGQ